MSEQPTNSIRTRPYLVDKKLALSILRKDTEQTQYRKFGPLLTIGLIVIVALIILGVKNWFGYSFWIFVLGSLTVSVQVRRVMGQKRKALAENGLFTVPRIAEITGEWFSEFAENGQHVQVRLAWEFAQLEIRRNHYILRHGQGPAGLTLIPHAAFENDADRAEFERTLTRFNVTAGTR